MKIRPILWHDWLYLLRHRRQFQSLDTLQALTRGAPLSWTQLISSFRPADKVFTGISETSLGERAFVGQIQQSPYLSNAHLTHLLIPEEQALSDLPRLLEELLKAAGNWGARTALAELAPESDCFIPLRTAGFSVIAKQRVYQLGQPPTELPGLDLPWRIWTSADIAAMRTLYLMLVPPLMQSVEPLTRLEMLGLIYYDTRGDLQAFADLVYGPAGVWVRPFVHPQASVNLIALMAQMQRDLPALYGRPVYVCARSYQPWIESALAQISTDQKPEQVVMVRHLALRQRVALPLGFKRFENGTTEPTYPIASSKVHRN